MNDVEAPCWICGSHDITYVDSIASPWCSDCMRRIYYGKSRNLPNAEEHEDCW